jgi:protein gp37
MTTVTRHVYQVLTKRPERMREYVLRWAKVNGALPPNVWLGTSIEMQGYVHRAAALRDLPVAVRWLSCEPLLGAIDLEDHLGPGGVNWVVTGGESGPRARPCDLAWVRAIRRQCEAAGVPFFHKQNGGVRKWEQGRKLDGRTWDAYPTAAALILSA